MSSAFPTTSELLSSPRRLSDLGRLYGYNPSPPKLEGLRRPTSKTALLQSRRHSGPLQPPAEVSCPMAVSCCSPLTASGSWLRFPGWFGSLRAEGPGPQLLCSGMAQRSAPRVEDAVHYGGLSPLPVGFPGGSRSPASPRAPAPRGSAPASCLQGGGAPLLGWGSGGSAAQELRYLQDVLTLSSSTDSDGDNGPKVEGQPQGAANDSDDIQTISSGSEEEEGDEKKNPCGSGE